ncbi:MAG: diguanylate cyclase [Thermoanaerobaculia bacterium]
MAGPLSAQGPDAFRPIELFDLGAPSFSSFTGRDGAPESVAVAIQTDSEGFVWLASPEGLYRYDGHRWGAISDGRDGAPAPGVVYDLTRDRQGRLWATLPGVGLACYDGRQWHVENRESGLPEGPFRRVVDTGGRDGTGEIWALSMDGQLLHRTGERWVRETGSEQLPPGPLIAAAQTFRLGGRERLWIGTFNQGVWYREDDRWRPFEDERFRPAQVEYLLATAHRGREELWISTFGSGLWRLDEQGLRAWNVASGDLPTDELYGLAETRLPDGDRAIWAASRSGLVRVHDDRAQIFDRRHGLPSNAVRGLSAWRTPGGTDVLWVATESGVARTLVGASPWQTASLLGSGSSGVFGVLVEPDSRGGERLWLATSADGLGLYEDGRWRQFRAESGELPDSDARVVVRAPDDSGAPVLWLGERGGYLVRIHERSGSSYSFETVPTPWSRHPGQAVMDILGRRSEGSWERWVATRQSGIWRSRGGVWTGFEAEGVVGQWRISRLLEQVEPGGRSWLWAATNQGLGRFDGRRWELFGTEIGLAERELVGLSAIPDKKGRTILWSGSMNHGVQRIDVSDPRSPTALEGTDLPPPPHPTTYAAVGDSRGRIYVCTNNGVQLLTPAGEGYVARVFTRRDGMVHEECNTNAQFVDSHDRFWTGTLGGLTVFDPEREIEDRNAKPLRLSAIRIDGAPLAAGPVHVPPGARELRVDFALLTWQRETESRYRTQLLPLEVEPGAWTSQNFRAFSALPPGRYSLRVDGRDYADNPSAPLELAIEVVPAWWQNGWVRALLAAAILAGLVAFVARRTRSLRSQHDRLEREVHQRTAELHQANRRLLELSHTDPLTGLANRRRLLERIEEIASEDRSGSRPAALVFVDVDHFKSYNDRFGHPAGDEALRGVAGVLRSTLGGGGLAARYGGEEFACLVDDADLMAGRALAERIRKGVEQLEVPVPGTTTVNRVTVSAGVASAPVSSAAEAHRMLRDADLALYQAKRDGRNCVRG